MPGLETQLFNLKFTAKQLNRLSTKCTKDEKNEKSKIKKALEKDNHDGARIHAQNAIRNKNMAQNYLRLSSRVDAVASRLESALKMQQVTKSMGQVVKGMDRVLGSMNIEAISKVMDQFERSFEDMDVRSEYVEQTMNSSTTAAMPEEEVDTLMQMVADEHGAQHPLPPIRRLPRSQIYPCTRAQVSKCRTIFAQLANKMWPSRMRKPRLVQRHKRPRPEECPWKMIWRSDFVGFAANRFRIGEKNMYL